VEPLPDLVLSLLDPGAYSEAERPERVNLIQTHISWLFLTSRFVYKVKKPVNFGFLDFTSLEKRRFFCSEELRLNRRLSPDVYLEVVPIWEESGRYTMHESGHIAEYAVKMRQLPGDRWLSALLRRGEATPELMRRIARRVAAFHASAERVEGPCRLGGLQTVRFNTEENFGQTRDQIGVTVSAETFDRAQAYTAAFLDARASIFARRETEGRIRDCHGDLHADQICVENGIAFIDCIEFNERFRYSDVAADIAFTAMDVDYWGRPDLSAELVREYVETAGDKGVLDVLDFYKCYRAFTRGKVRGFRLRQPGLTDGERQTIIEQASRYFTLAESYAQLPGPLFVAMSGLMGTGKTSLARALGPRLGAKLLTSDIVRKELTGSRPEEPHWEPWGEGIYADDFSTRTYAELHRRAGELLQAGQIVIVDASYRKAAWRADARATALASSAPFLLLEVVCPDPIVRERLSERGAGPSDGRVELLDRQREEFEPPVDTPQKQRVRIDTSGTPDEVAKAALGAVYRQRLALG